MKTITATELARKLSDVLNRVWYKGEEFVVERGGEPIATIAPACPGKQRTFGEFLSLLESGPRPDSDFADDLERIHAEQPSAVEAFPDWPS